MEQRRISLGQPFWEKERLAELHSLGILDTPREESFDCYTRLLAEIFTVPMAAVPLIDEERHWFKSSVGVEVNETPLEASLCVHALEKDMLEIPDTLEDEFFCHHASVVGSPFIRFYMGTVLRGPTSQPLGTLCIMDTHSRYLSRTQRNWLTTFGHLVEDLIHRDHALTAARQRGSRGSQRNAGTGLPDETFFLDSLTYLLDLSEQEGRHLAVLYLRVNRLDEIGRAHGRGTRDAVLNSLSMRLAAPDIKALATGHFSLDRFGAVVPLPHLQDLYNVITPILHKLANPIQVEDTTIKPDIDAGVSLSPLDGRTSEELLSRARSALSGPTSRAGIHVFSHQAEEAALRQHTIEQLLEKALLEQRLTKHYQPLVASDGSRIVGFEALARWIDTELGYISPGEFIPIAEKNARLSRKMTEWSLRTVCEQAGSWPLQHRDEALKMSINIPPAQFYHGGFVNDVLTTLEEHEVPPEHLTLELTEQSLMTNVDQAIQTMRDLRGHNITVALDDFGTGYSSLSYLKNLPLDILKIDKSFIEDLPHDRRAVDLMGGIARIARGVGLEIVAEGVEQENQRALLHDLGCDVVQGYLFSRPLAAPDAQAWLHNFRG